MYPRRCLWSQGTFMYHRLPWQLWLLSKLIFTRKTFSCKYTKNCMLYTAQKYMHLKLCKVIRNKSKVNMFELCKFSDVIIRLVYIDIKRTPNKWYVRLSCQKCRTDHGQWLRRIICCNPQNSRWIDPGRYCDNHMDFHYVLSTLITLRMLVSLPIL